jgi:hypothetical protein
VDDAGPVPLAVVVVLGSGNGGVWLTLLLMTVMSGKHGDGLVEVPALGGH